MHSTGPCLLLCSIVLASLFRLDDPDNAGGHGGIVTLYAHDDLQSSFDFRSGWAGGRVFDGEVHIEAAQIAFDLFAPGEISIGFTRDERVDALDLGPVVVPPQTRVRDRAEEFPISLFHTLFLGDNGFAYVGPGGDVDPYERADRILTAPATQGIRHFAPEVGHVYLLRARRNDSSVIELFKFQVIGLLPEHSLTIRWARVSG